MRLRLLLETSEPITLPWDYRTDLTRAVYEILQAGDSEYGGWLHNYGFRWGNRVYRLFVYSDLMPTHRRFTPQGLADVRWMIWQIGSPDPRFAEAFMRGLARGLADQGGRLTLFGATVEVVDVAPIEAPALGSGLAFHTLSPIAASVGDPGRSPHPIYLSPDQPEFVEALRHNLIAKWQAFHGRPWQGGELEIRVWSPQRKLLCVFGTKVRAWHLRLQMWGDEDLIRFAYDAGLGIRNSQGFGMIEPGG